MKSPRYFATVDTGSPAQAAYLLANGFALKAARVDRRGHVIFKFDGAATNALKHYQRAQHEIRAHLERARQDTPRHDHAQR
jgi:hypothetical protein